MVALGSGLRRASTESSRLRGGLLDDRLLRKAFSARGLLTRKPGLVLTLAFVGALTVAVLSFNLLAVAASKFLNAQVPLLLASDAASHGRYLDESGAPRQIFVVAGGAPRTGSTFIFNLLRVLMRIRDPNTVASSNWMLAKLVPENKTLEEFDRVKLLRTMGTSILVKVHTAKQYYEFVGPLHKNKFADEVDLLVTGYRDLRYETVSAFKMFAKNRTEWEVGSKWAEMCQALIRRRNSLIKEAGTVVPVVDIRYEDWKDGGIPAMLKLVRQLAASLPWQYTENDLLNTLHEVQRMRVPAGGEVGNRVEWHVSNLMSPKHISVEHLSEELVSMGLQAINNEPACAQWLSEKQYV